MAKGSILWRAGHTIAFSIGEAIGFLGIALRRGPDDIAVPGRPPPPPAVLALVNFPAITALIGTFRHASPRLLRFTRCKDDARPDDL